MKLVRLEDVLGNDTWVNPECIVAVAVLPDEGHTVIVLSDGTKGAVKGTPAAVAQALMGGGNE